MGPFIAPLVLGNVFALVTNGFAILSLLGLTAIGSSFIRAFLKSSDSGVVNDIMNNINSNGFNMNDYFSSSSCTIE